ncbi:MAG: glutathione S-transferase [Alteromonadaceae bacterium]|nr:MAG: glutathione S-transferase [Alteromonadaceae bacterium]
MKLYGSYSSPFVRHCRIVLLEVGFESEFIETDASASAERSPAKRVPFFSDEGIQLTDSSSIVRYLREKAGQNFLPNCIELDRYCLINAALDSAINLFFLERSNPELVDGAYITCNRARVDAILSELNATPWPAALDGNDLLWRLACFLDWGLYRKRYSFDQHENLMSFLDAARKHDLFIQTAPPA